MKTHRINYAYFLVLLLFIFIYNGFKTKLPKGLSNEGKIRDSEVKFIYDLSYKKDGDMIYEKNIFSKIKSMVEEAEEFIIIDMFLFGEDLRAEGKYEDISNQLSELLIEKKNIDSEIQIVFITDEINSFYGSYEPKNLKNMRKKGIQVVYTDLEKLPDSNPIYSGIWRSLFNKIKTNKPGKLPNPFGPMGPKTKLSSCLRALNMKANHRKVIITEKDALVTS